MVYQTFFLIFLNCFITTVPSTASDSPDKTVPELEVLSLYAGTWEVEIDSEQTSVKREVTSEWVLNGRFLQRYGVIGDIAPFFKQTELMTFDVKVKSYRMWSFDSRGTVVESTGKWDAEKKTFTWLSSNEGYTKTTTANFSEDGISNWTIVSTNPKGEVTAKVDGVSKRHK